MIKLSLNPLLKRTFILPIAFILISAPSSAQTSNNAEMQKMADEDQQSRMKSPIDWQILNREDSLRRVRVFELINAGQVITAQDHLNAGIIFQHGNDTTASRMAVLSFKKALQLDSTLNRWWYAAAVDRDLMRRNEPQIYGTQFIKNNHTNGRFVRYQIDTTQISDEERRYYHVETLAEQAAKERSLNLKSITTIKGSTDEQIVILKNEFKKGQSSDYNISEESINSLGYELLNKKQLADALKIFELNTQLYPEGFNTFDSYGEALMMAGEKKKALKAYKKSLKLNPENENARKVIQNGNL